MNRKAGSCRVAQRIDRNEKTLKHTLVQQKQLMLAPMEKYCAA